MSLSLPSLNVAAGSSLLLSRQCSSWPPLSTLPSPVPCPVAPHPSSHPSPCSCFDHKPAPWAPSSVLRHATRLIAFVLQVKLLPFSWNVCPHLHLSKPNGTSKAEVKCCLFWGVLFCQPGRMKHLLSVPIARGSSVSRRTYHFPYYCCYYLQICFFS